MNRHQPYRPWIPQIPADPLRENPCDPRDPQRCVPPLKGHQKPLAASVSYRALSTYGESLPLRISTTCSDVPQPILNSEFLILNWTFTFSAKENDPETGLSYFGSRYYSSDLSIWLSVDPMSDKYASLSPYTYCADNPVRCVDPNGEDIEIVTETDANGKLIITISFTAKIENKSSHAYSKEEMEQIRDDISAGIKRYYSRQYDNATVVTNVDIICNKDERTNDLMKEGNRHSIYIVDKCSKEDRIAEAEDNGRFMNIKRNIGQGTNGNNLQRTAAHEFGHLLGLPDIELTDNLMCSGGTGTNLTWGQIQEAVANYKQLKINIGIPTRNFERIVEEHKQRYKRGR